MQTCKMDLGDRGGGNGDGIEFCKDFGQRLFVAGLDHGHRLHRRKRRHPILQQRELIGDIERNQVAPGRQHLPEFDKNRAQSFQRAAQAHRAWLG